LARERQASEANMNAPCNGSSQASRRIDHMAGFRTASSGTTTRLIGWVVFHDSASSAWACQLRGLAAKAARVAIRDGARSRRIAVLRIGFTRRKRVASSGAARAPSLLVFATAAGALTYIKPTPACRSEIIKLRRKGRRLQ